MWRGLALFDFSESALVIFFSAVNEGVASPGATITFHDLVAD
jgi:hypothetical protein